MSNNEHSLPAESQRTFRCTFGPVREKDLVWPPPDAELDAFEVVRLDGAPPFPDGVAASGETALAAAAGADAGSGVEASTQGPAQSSTQGVETPLPRIAALKPARVIKTTFGDCRAPGVAPRIRPMVVPMVPVAPPVTTPAGEASESVAHATEREPERHAEPLAETLPAAVVVVEPPALEAAHLAAVDPENGGASRSAWLAAIFAAACLALAVFEYREIFAPVAEAGVAMAEAPPLPGDMSTAELAPASTRVAALRSPAAAPSMPTPTERPVAAAVTPARPPTPTPSAPVAAPAPKMQAPSVTPAPPRVAVTRPAVSPVEPKTPLRQAPIPAPMVAVRSEAAVTRALPPAPAPSPRPLSPPPPPAPAPAAKVAVRAAAPTPAPVPMPEPAALDTTPNRPAAAVLTAAVDTDEADIRSTLTRFRAAYSQLNARAARDVWPSVDTRALERAFQSLKSQELRFESCNLTVTGARAQAACKGRAVYVPRIGDQSPRLTDREWTFELRKADERWTIASARTL